MTTIGEIAGGPHEIGPYIERIDVGEHERQRVGGVVQRDATEPLDDREVMGVGLHMGIGDLDHSHGIPRTSPWLLGASAGNSRRA